MFDRKFWIDAFERTVKTFAQTWAALLTASGLGVIDVQSLWTQVQVALLASLAALLMAVGGSQIGSDRTAAWLPEGPDTEDGAVRYDLITAVASVAMLALLVCWAWDLGPFAP